MEVKTKFVFKTSGYYFQPEYAEFNSAHALKKFLQEFDFSHRHHVGRVIRHSMPEFRLGTRISFVLDGHECNSDIKWGPKFLDAKDTHIDERGNRHVVCTVDDYDNLDTVNSVVPRKYTSVCINPHEYDAIIDLKTLRQLWPAQERVRSVLNHFCSAAAKKYTIR